jgi:hypothetical protein
MIIKAISLAVATLLLSAVTVGTLSTDNVAEAKAGSPTHKFSKWIKKVCGDELCPGTPYMKTKQKIARSSPNR